MTRDVKHAWSDRTNSERRNRCPIASQRFGRLRKHLATSQLFILLFLCLGAPSAVAGDLPPFHLNLIPSPAFDTQQLQIGITRPGCYGILANEQYPHSMQIKDNVILYTVPIVLGVQPIGCTNAPATFHISIGQLPAGEYDFTLRALSVHNQWDGLIEVGQIQFEVLANLAAPRPQVVSTQGWVSLTGLIALLLLVGGWGLTGRSGRI